MVSNMDDLVICEAILEVLIKEAEMPSVIDPSIIPTGGTKMTAIDNKSGKPVQVEKIVGPDGKDIIKVETEFCGRVLSLEVGRVGFRSTASVLARYGDTVVLASAMVSPQKVTNLDYFPLSIDYEEKSGI